MSNEPIDMELRVGQYVKLRDTIRDMDDAHKEKMRPYREALEKLNTLILQHLKDINTRSVSTGAGTAFIAERRSASIADGIAFWQYVKKTGLFDLIDARANAPAVLDHISEHGVPPPGVNFSTRLEVNVRRKT